MSVLCVAELAVGEDEEGLGLTLVQQALGVMREGQGEGRGALVMGVVMWLGKRGC